MFEKIKKEKVAGREKSNPFYALLLALSVIYFIMCLVMDQRYMSNALILSLVPCGSTILILLSGAKKPKLDKTDNAFLWLFSLLCMIMLSYIDISIYTVNVMTENAALRALLNVFFFSCCYFSTYFSLSFAYASFVKSRELKTDTDKKKPYLFYLIIIAFVTLIFTAASGYGYDFADTITIYSYYKDRGIWFDWHTISHEIFVVLCMKLMPGAPFVFSAVLVQTALWLCVTNYALKSLYEAFGSIKVIKVYTVLSLLIISPLFFASVILKDPMFSMFMYAYAISIFNFVRKEVPSGRDYFWLALNASLASLFRHAAVAVIAVSIIAFVIFRIVKYKNKKDIKKYIAVALAPIVVFFGVTVGIGDGILHKYPNPSFVKYTMPIYLSVACADKLGDEFGAENEKVLEQIMPVEEWIRCYNEDKYWADTVTRDWGGIKEKVYDFDQTFYDGIIEINKSMVLNHTKEYVKSIFEITDIVWRVTNSKDCKRFEYPTSTLINKEELFHATVADEILGSVLDFSGENAITCSIIWRGGLWILVAVFSSFILIRKKRAELLFMILHIVVYAATLFISIPAQDPRYILCFIEVGMFYALVAFFSDKKEKEKALSE
ncbi:MAG: hypothetical protein IKF64_07025 [Eubacterium sp.]|nr:hypothetical protein [Eubacterium sp.]